MGWGLRAVAQGYNYMWVSLNWGLIFKGTYRVYNKKRLGLGWLRAVVQCYNYSCSKIEFKSNFQNNWLSLGIQFGWGLGCCERRCTAIVTVAIQLTWNEIFKRIPPSTTGKAGWIWDCPETCSTVSSSIRAWSPQNFSGWPKTTLSRWSTPTCGWKPFNATSAARSARFWAFPPP